MSILLQDLKYGIRLLPKTPALAVALATVFGIHAGAQKVDTKAAAAAIMKLDADFDRSVTDRDRAKFLSFLADTALFVGDVENRGRDAIMKAWSPFFEADGPRLTWKPTHAEVLVGGDLGYTVGTWTRRSRDPDGKPSEAHGQYLTTWRKQKDGSWKIVYDIGSTAP